MFDYGQIGQVDLSKWNVETVTSMHKMFYSAYDFNSDLSNWDVSAVRDMHYMFYGHGEHMSFAGSVANWDLSSVTDVDSMFRYSAPSDLTNWTLPKASSGINLTFNQMFAHGRIGQVDIKVERGDCHVHAQDVLFRIQL